MGYITDYYGTITLSKLGIEKLNKFIKLDVKPKEVGEIDLEEHFDLEGINFHDGKIELSGYGKMNENQLKRFSLFIAMLDKESYGEIRCWGEEKGDIWRIVICEGKAKVEAGRITYHKDYNFEDIETKKEIYKITKDKTLMKEIILEELE